MSILNGVFEAYDACLIEGRFEDAAAEIKQIMEQNKENQQVYYWALKRYGDFIGYGFTKDYLQAIDIYQSIITEYENDEDDLFDWCQLDIAKSYLHIATSAFQMFDEMKDIIEQSGEERAEYLERLIEDRNEFIESQYEAMMNERI